MSVHIALQEHVALSRSLLARQMCLYRREWAVQQRNKEKHHVSRRCDDQLSYAAESGQLQRLFTAQVVASLS